MLFKLIDDKKVLKTDRQYLLDGIGEAIDALELLEKSTNLTFEDSIYVGQALATLRGIKRGAEEYGYKD